MKQEVKPTKKNRDRRPRGNRWAWLVALLATGGVAVSIFAQLIAAGSPVEDTTARTAIALATGSAQAKPTTQTATSTGVTGTASATASPSRTPIRTPSPRPTDTATPTRTPTLTPSATPTPTALPDRATATPVGPVPTTAPTATPLPTQPGPTATPPPVEELGCPATPFGGIAGYTQGIFCDSFEGTGVKTSLWNVNWFGKTINDITEPITRPDEQGCYDIKQLQVSNGRLTIHVDNRPGCKVTPGNQDPGYTMNYAGGIINTRNKETFTYGLFETRVRIDACPNGKFANYFFWATMGQNFPADGEIDAPEMRGGNAGYWYHSSSPTVGGSNSSPTAPGNQAGVFNTYSFEWQPGVIIWRYNGVEVFRVTGSSVSNKALWLHLVYNAGQQICVPATADIEYVKVWKKS